MDALVGGHGIGRVGVVVVRRPPLGALSEGEHEERTESSPEGDEQPTAEAGGPGVSLGIVAGGGEQVDPVLLVALLGVGETAQDLALLAGVSLGELTVESAFGSFVGQIATPASPPGAIRAGHRQTPLVPELPAEKRSPHEPSEDSPGSSQRSP